MDGGKNHNRKKKNARKRGERSRVRWVRMQRLCWPGNGREKD
jgi:hypothetical protein